MNGGKNGFGIWFLDMIFWILYIIGVNKFFCYWIYDIYINDNIIEERFGKFWVYYCLFEGGSRFMIKNGGSFKEMREEV